jgi:hypothetical protein
MDENDGQHREYPTTPGASQGMPTKRVSGAYVGQKCGPVENMKVPATRKDADISTTSNSGGPLSRGEARGGADDKR